MKQVEVILLAPLKRRGDVGQLVKVAAGFARNFLLPKSLAIVASKKNKEQLQHQMRLASHQKAKDKARAEADAKKLSAITLTFARKVGEQGKLFGSVTSLDVHRALAEQGFAVDKKDLHLANTIHQLGPDVAEVRLAHDVRAKVNLMVVLES